MSVCPKCVPCGFCKGTGCIDFEDDGCTFSEGCADCNATGVEEPCGEHRPQLDEETVMECTGAKPCGHDDWSRGHCAEMACANYVNKCADCLLNITYE